MQALPQATSIAVAVSMFLKGQVDKVILSRPAVEAGERLGFLPGDIKDKIDPYMQPLYDALNDFLPEKQVSKMLEDKRIEIIPLAFMRGRTLSNSFIILDEGQNATHNQMKMFLTRLGRNSKAAITGDLSQIDLPSGVKCQKPCVFFHMIDMTKHDTKLILKPNVIPASWWR